MASNIDPTIIDGNYPIAGKDQPSQPFRTNFTGIGENFTAAAAEITELQGKAVLKAALSGTTLDNNMQGAEILSGKMRDLLLPVASLNWSSGQINSIDVLSGGFQQVRLDSSGSYNTIFNNFSRYSGYSSIVIQVDNVGNNRWVLPGGKNYLGLETITGADGNSIYFYSDDPTTTSSRVFSISSPDNQTFILQDITDNPSSLNYGEPTNYPLGQPGDKQGDVRVEQGNLYVCTLNYDGVTDIWTVAGGAGGGAAGGPNQVQYAVTAPGGGLRFSANPNFIFSNSSGQLSVPSVYATQGIQTFSVTITGNASVADTLTANSANVNNLRVNNLARFNTIEVTNVRVSNIISGVTGAFVNSLANTLTVNNTAEIATANVTQLNVSNLSLNGIVYANSGASGNANIGKVLTVIGNNQLGFAAIPGVTITAPNLSVQFADYSTGAGRYTGNTNFTYDYRAGQSLLSTPNLAVARLATINVAGINTATVTSLAATQANVQILRVANANINGQYTLTNAAPVANGYVLTGYTDGTTSWQPTPAVYGNSNVIGLLANLGSNSISTTGNVTAGYLIGNGAFLTGISGGSGSYSNANVANYLPTYSGNIGIVNATLQANIGTYLRVQANASIGSTLTVGNAIALYANGQIRTTATVHATGNVRTDSTLVGAAVVAGTISGQQFLPIAANGAVSNLAQDIGRANAYFRNVYAGEFITPAGAVGNPTQITPNPSAGESGIVFTDAVTGQAASLSAGDVFVTALTASNTIVAGTSITAPAVTATGNVTANLYFGNGYYLTGIPYSNLVGAYSNLNVANYLPVYNGNILAGNILASNNVIIQGNLQVVGTEIIINSETLVVNDKNIVIANGSPNPSAANGAGFMVGNTGNSYSDITWTWPANIWTFNSNGIVTSGNVDAAGNISASYYFGNGYYLSGINAANLIGAYSNANVAAYLPTYTGNLVSLTGDVTTTANVTANYFIGNIRSATGGYGNANVAEYLPTYTGNLASSSDIIALYANAVQQSNAIAEVNANVVGANNNIALANAAIANLQAAQYSNANAAAYLASNANIVIVTQGNITTTANVSGSYLLGNIRSATGGYNDANVAAYLPTANVDATLKDLTVSGNAVILGNLRVEGNTTYINVSDLVVEDKDIIIAANANATLSDLNGAGLQIGNRAAGGNITFFYDSTDNVMSLSHGLRVANNVSTGFYYGNGYYLTGLNAANLVGAYSNANVAAYLASNANLTISVGTGNITTQGRVTAGNLTITSNASIGDTLNTGTLNAAYINLDGTLTAFGNITTSREVIATGNITANYYYGNGYYLTGIQYSNLVGAYSNLNVANYLPTYTGNLASLTGDVVTTANISGAYLLGNGAFITGINAGNLIGAYSNANVANYLPTYTGNLALSSDIIALYANAAAQGNAIIAINANVTSANNNIALANAAIAAVNANVVGANNNIALANAAIAAANANIAALQANVYSNANAAAYLASNANIAIVTQGNITTVANISGSYILGNGAFLTGLPAQYSNANVANYLPVYGGNISAGTLSAAYVIIDGTLGAIGNITTSANLQGNYVLGNGAFLTGLPAQYSNANVANYLPTYTGALPALTGNVTTTANIRADNVLGNAAVFLGNLQAENIRGVSNIEAQFYFGNGYYLTGINAANLLGAYSNANVANYLPTYTGNIGANSITATGNVVIQGNLQVLGTETIINTTSLSITDKDIIVAANAISNTQANGAGIIVGNATPNIANILYISSPGNDRWVINPGLTVQGNISAANDITANNVTVTGDLFADDFVGNAVNVTTSFTVGGATTTYFQAYTTSDTPDQAIYSVAANISAQLDFNIVATDPSMLGGSRTAAKLLSTTYGNSTEYIEYGGVSINTPVADFKVDQSAGLVRLLVSPGSNANIAYSVLITRLV